MKIPNTPDEIDAAVEAQEGAHVDIGEDPSRITDLSALLSPDLLRQLLEERAALSGEGQRGAEVPPLGPVETTSRGFEIIKFNDLGDEDCSLQQSSLAVYEKPGSSAVWLGVGGARMHLSWDAVASLVSHLSAWLQTGSFASPSTEAQPPAAPVAEKGGA